jgi:hypothetical protein
VLANDLRITEPLIRIEIDGLGRPLQHLAATALEDRPRAPTLGRNDLPVVLP